MENIFSIVGSIASIGGIPLAIYLYLKSKEANFDKIKRDIVKILSYQIGEDRELTTFEIQSVINSKLRESRMKIDEIEVNEVIEDLVSETISSPLLDTERKHTILGNLKTIHYKGELIDEIEKITINIHGDDNIIKVDDLEDKVRQIIKSREEIEEKVEQATKRSNEQVRLSSIYATLIGIIGSIVAALAIIGSEKIVPILEGIKIDSDTLKFLTSMIVTIFAASISFGLKYWMSDTSEKSKEKKKKTAENIKG